MSIGEYIREARESAEMSQVDLSFMLNVSRSMLGMVETEKRKLPLDVMIKAMEVLDDGTLELEVIEEVLGYTFLPKLDGPRVDDHRSSVKSKTLEELPEAIEAINGVCIANHPDYIDDADRDKLFEALEESAEAVIALLSFIIAICRDYRFSWRGLWKHVENELIEKGYVRA